MGELFKHLYDNWPEGANTSAEPDELSPTMFVVGKNTALRSITPTKAIICKRRGVETVNDVPITGSTAVVGQHEFRKLDSSTGTFTNYHLTISDSGEVDVFSATGVAVPVSNPPYTPLTASTTQAHLPTFADANNLCFFVNGEEARKFNGTTIYKMGIAPPIAPILSIGTSGNHNGTYEGRVTFFNTATGHESSAGPTSNQVTATNDSIDWFISPSGDPQVDARRLYIRNVATQPDFFLVTTIEDNTTTTFTSSLFDSSLVTHGPDEDSNGLPPDGVRYLAWHKSRMFAATDKEVFYSPIEDPESFDPENVEPVNPDDSQKITGLFSAFNVLVIFKSSSMYAIVGDDPETWSVELIDPAFGCVAHRSIVFAGNALYFWGEQGPAKWDGTGPPQWLGPNKIARTISPEVLSSNPTELAKICGIEDITNQRVVWAVPELSQARNTLLLPYSHRLNAWESTGWDPVDVSSMASVLDTIGRPYVMLGGYSGQVFKLGVGNLDGVATTDTYVGTFVATSTALSTITDLAATFPIVGGGFIERKVTVVNSEGLPMDDVRPRITANTATTLTLSTPVQGFVVGQTYTYYVGGPAFYLTTAWLDQGDAFAKKRYQHAFVLFRPTNNSIDALVDLQFDYQTNRTGTDPFVITMASAAIWGSALWGGFQWGGVESAVERFRVGRTGRAIQLRVQHYVPNVGLDILKVGLTGEYLFEYLK